MSLLKLLGWAEAEPPAERLAATIQARLTDLPPTRAEFVAAFAGLLVRVAYVDRSISEAERAVLAPLLAANAGLPEAEAATVMEIVAHRATTLAGISYASLTRAFNAIATAEEKERLIDCLFAVATAEGSISLVEDEEVRAVARALLLSHRQLIAVRSRYKDQLEVIQAARQARGA
ncbi:MAG: TerB family tellurite resistance protein [Deltaproteobacteria bacterium]|nr:TerB family tellurite resistance protein [Deltaproteobacteria bacterium]